MKVIVRAVIWTCISVCLVAGQVNVGGSPAGSSATGDGKPGFPTNSSIPIRTLEVGPTVLPGGLYDVRATQFAGGARGAPSDDSLAIQAAWAEASASGSTLYFPAGWTFSGCNIVLRSQHPVTIYAYGATFVPSCETGWMFTLYGSYHTWLGGSFVGTGGKHKKGIKITNDAVTPYSQKITLRDIRMQDLYQGIWNYMDTAAAPAGATYRLRLDNVIIENSYQTGSWAGSFGISFDGNTTGNAAGNDSYVVGGEVRNYETNIIVRNSSQTKLYGVALDGATNAVAYDSGSDLELVGVRFEYNANDFTVLNSPSHLTIIGGTTANHKKVFNGSLAGSMEPLYFGDGTFGGLSLSGYRLLLNAPTGPHITFGTNQQFGSLPSRGSSLWSSAGVSYNYNGTFIESNGDGNRQFNAAVSSWRVAIGSGAQEWAGADAFCVGRVPPNGVYEKPVLVMCADQYGHLSIPALKARSKNYHLCIDPDGLVTSRLQGCAVDTSTVTGSQFKLSPGWGSAATVSSIAGTVSNWTTTITANGTGMRSDPSFTVKFEDGAFAYPPGCFTKMEGGSGPDGVVWDKASRTENVVTWIGTPQPGNSYTFNGFCFAR